MLNSYDLWSKVDDWEKKHGGNRVRHLDSFLFPDGARRDVNRMGELLDPPSDPYKRHQLIVKYYEVVVTAAEQEFMDFKNQLAALTKAQLRNGYGPPDRASFEQLQKLRDAVMTARQNLEKARADLTKNTPQSVSQREAHKAWLQQATMDYANQVQQIQI